MRNIKNNSKTLTSQQEISNLDFNINSLTGSEVLVYDHIQGMNNITHRIFLSQTYLARKLGLCRATINRALKRLAELGLLQKIDRGWKEERTRIKKTCFYIVSSLFDLPEIRKRYQYKFKSLIYLKLVGKFEQLIESGFKHYDKIVTGIKSYTNSLFKNSRVADTSIKFQRRRGLLLGRRLKQAHSRTIIERKVVMTEFTLPRVLQEAAFLNLAAKMDLAVFNEAVISHAFAKLAVAKDIARPYGYIKGICKSETTKRGLSLYDRHSIPMVEGEAEVDMEGFKRLYKSASLGVSAVLQNKQKSEEKRQAVIRPYIPTPPAPMWHLSDEQNLQRMEKFYESKEVEDYIAFYGEKGRRDIVILTNKFSEIMKRHTPEAITKYYNNAISMGFGEVAELAKKNHPFLNDVKVNIRNFQEGTLASHITQTIKPKEVDYKSLLTLLERKEPTILNTANNKSTVAFVPDTSKFEPESITPNEVDYDEVLD